MASSREYVELMLMPLFKELVDIRMRQINENLKRFCEDPSYQGNWEKAIFAYRPSKFLGRKDQWKEVREHVLKNPEGAALRHLIGGPLSTGQALKRMLNLAVFEKKSPEEWQKEYEKCKMQSGEMRNFYNSLSSYDQGLVDGGISEIVRDMYGNLKLQRKEIMPSQADIEAAQRYEESIYYGGKRHRRTHRRQKAKSAKKGGKSRRHHKKAHRKTHKKY